MWSYFVTLKSSATTGQAASRAAIRGADVDGGLPLHRFAVPLPLAGEGRTETGDAGVWPLWSAATTRVSGHYEGSGHYGATYGMRRMR